MGGEKEHMEDVMDRCCYLEGPLDPLEGGGPPLGRVVRVGKQELRQLPLRDPAGGVRLLLGELQPQDLTLQSGDRFNTREASTFSHYSP